MSCVQHYEFIAISEKYKNYKCAENCKKSIKRTLKCIVIANTDRFNVKCPFCKNS